MLHRSTAGTNGLDQFIREGALSSFVVSVGDFSNELMESVSYGFGPFQAANDS